MCTEDLKPLQALGGELKGKQKRGNKPRPLLELLAGTQRLKDNSHRKIYFIIMHILDIFVSIFIMHGCNLADAYLK